MHTKSKLSLWLSFLIPILCFAEGSHSKLDAKVASVIATLEKCPSWTVAKGDRSEIIAIYSKLASEDTAVLRGGIIGYVTKLKLVNEWDIASMGKIFALNRYLFMVPTKEKLSGPFFGGWVGIPIENEMINVQWPWSLDKNGSLILTGHYEGYGGPPYRAIEEFELFAKKYARRSSAL